MPITQKRSLKILKDKEYGFSTENTIHVNIERIWKETKSSGNFTREFARTYDHELMHILLNPELKRKRVKERTEERIIRNLLREPWNSAISRGYN